MSQPVDWPGLLKWSLAYHDGTNDKSDIRELSEEDKQFIMNAMDNMTVDEFKRIKILLNVIRIPEDREKLRAMAELSQEAIQAIEDSHNLKTVLQMREHSEKKKDSCPRQFTEFDLDNLLSKLKDEKLNALDELQDRILKIDNSIALTTLDGHKALYEALMSGDMEIRQQAILIAAAVVQHNDKAKDKFVGSQFFLSALEYLRLIQIPTTISSFPSSYNVKPTAFDKPGYIFLKQILSYFRSQTENHLISQRSFIQHGGLSILYTLISALSSKVEEYVADKDDKSLQYVLNIIRTGNYLLMNLLETNTSVPFSLDISYFYRQLHGSSPIQFAYDSKMSLDKVFFGKYVNYLLNPSFFETSNSFVPKVQQISTTQDDSEPISRMKIVHTNLHVSEPINTDKTMALIELDTPATNNEDISTQQHNEGSQGHKGYEFGDFWYSEDKILVPIATIVRETMAIAYPFSIISHTVQYGDYLSRYSAAKLVTSYTIAGSPSSVASFVPATENFMSTLAPKFEPLSNGTIALKGLRDVFVIRVKELQSMKEDLNVDPSQHSDIEEEIVLFAVAMKVIDDLRAGKHMTVEELSTEWQ